MRQGRKLLGVAAGLTVVAIALMISGYYSGPGSSEMEFSLEPVTRGSITKSVLASGTLKAVVTVDIGTQVSGMIKSLSADFNSEVKTGQVLCIVEAMKLMNEIESDIDGVVVEVFGRNSQPVEFGEPLFAIQLT